jgi:hypothetical protein
MRLRHWGNVRQGNVTGGSGVEGHVIVVIVGSWSISKIVCPTVLEDLGSPFVVVFCSS